MHFVARSFSRFLPKVHRFLDLTLLVLKVFTGALENKYASQEVYSFFFFGGIIFLKELLVS